MVRKSFLMLFITLIIMCGGCKTSQPPQSETPAAVSTVRNYIALSSEGNWKRALNHLSGEALQDAENNLKKNPEVKSSMELKSISSLSSNALNNFAIIRADFVKGEDNKVIYYHLRKIDGRWLIYKLSHQDPKLPADFKLSTVSPELRKYLEIRFSEFATKTIPNANVEQIFKGLSFVCLGDAEGITLVEATYTVNTTSDRAKDMRVLYTLLEDKGTWRVAGTDVVQKK